LSQTWFHLRISRFFSSLDSHKFFPYTIPEKSESSNPDTILTIYPSSSAIASDLKGESISHPLCIPSVYEALYGLGVFGILFACSEIQYPKTGELYFD
jgi:hypothetical protein